jgi:hypothetical protein
MRVVCVKFLDPVTGEERAEDSWLKLDRDYPVLSIDVEADRRVWLRIESEEAGTPALFDAEMFLTTSTALPSNWRVRVGEGGSLELAPEAWLRAGFWEDFFDRVPEAMEAYEKERAATLAEVGGA